MTVQILVDNPGSWFNGYLDGLCLEISRRTGELPSVVRSAELVKPGKFLFVLSCDKVVPKEILKRVDRAFVVHESNLPEGRGWSPVHWQVEAGKNKICVCLFEAGKGLDDGDVFVKEFFVLDGSELLPEIRFKQYALTERMILNVLVYNWLFDKGKPQSGKPSFFRKRTEADNELDANKSIASQFNRMRVCDNERYPAWFELNGCKYFVRLNKKGVDKNG